MMSIINEINQMLDMNPSLKKHIYSVIQESIIKIAIPLSVIIVVILISLFTKSDENVKMNILKNSFLKKIRFLTTGSLFLYGCVKIFPLINIFNIQNLRSRQSIEFVVLFSLRDFLVVYSNYYLMAFMVTIIASLICYIIYEKYHKSNRKSIFIKILSIYFIRIFLVVTIIYFILLLGANGLKIFYL